MLLDLLFHMCCFVWGPYIYQYHLTIWYFISWLHNGKNWLILSNISNLVWVFLYHFSSNHFEQNFVPINSTNFWKPVTVIIMTHSEYIGMLLICFPWTDLLIWSQVRYIYAVTYTCISLLKVFVFGYFWITWTSSKIYMKQIYEM